LDAGYQDPGGLAGSGQLALDSGFLEELVGLVAAGFGVGEDGGERRPGRVGEDPLGVVGDGCSHVADQNATGFLPGRAGCEFGKRRGECAVGGCLEVLDSLAGGVGLVGVVLRFVPAPGNDGGPGESRDQCCQRAAVRARGGVDDVACRAAQGVGGTVFRPDMGPLGSGEHLRGGLEFGAQVVGSLLGGGFDQLAKGDDVSLGVCVVGARPAKRFVWTAVSLTAISLIPPLLSGANTATTTALLGLHLVPATVVIPTLARSLRTRTD
jgi:hypothetical protein